MKLKNKKTGEIADYNPTLERWNGPSKEIKHYDSLAGLNAEWEDYEEPKEYWFIGEDGNPHTVPSEHYIFIERIKEFGNYFSSRKEAERAVDKLKAWKRLKDKGFEFIYDGETGKPMFVYSGANREKCVTTAEESKQCMNDVKFIFGGEDA